MSKELQIQVRVSRLALSPTAARVLGRLDEYDWILFTSQNAVAFFMQELRQMNMRFPKGLRIAAVGPQTAGALTLLGVVVHVIPEQYEVSHMLRDLGDVAGKRVLFPRSAIAPPFAVESLRARGASVRVLPLYTAKARVLSRTVKRAIREGHYTKLMFTSPSGVLGFMKQLNKKEKLIVREIAVCCIGPITAQAAQNAGFTVVSIKRVE